MLSTAVFPQPTLTFNEALAVLLEHHEMISSSTTPTALNGMIIASAMNTVISVVLFPEELIGDDDIDGLILK